MVSPKLTLAKPFLAVCFALCTLGVTAGLAQTPTLAIGGEVQANSYTTSFQWLPSATLLESGEAVVVWESDGGLVDTDGRSIQGRRFSSSGDLLGDAFLVNTYTTGNQDDPVAAASPDGGFVVVWSSVGADGDTSGASVQGQRFDSSGDPVGAQFQVNAYTTGDQSEPAVEVAGDGTFTVVWTSSASDNGDTSNSSVQGRRFASDGTALGDQFLVNDYTTNLQEDPSVAVAENGRFVVAWKSYGSPGDDVSNRSIQARTFGSDGLPVGAQFQVNTYTTSTQEEPHVSAAPDGRFIVAWASFGSDNGDGSNHGIQAQRFAADGTAVGAQMLVNSFTPGGQRTPSVGVDAVGDFVVTWRSYGSDNGDNSRNSVQGRRFDSSGSPVAGQFRVNTYVVSDQAGPSLAIDEAGDFVVAWHSSGSSGDDDSNYSIQFQKYRVTSEIGDRLFSDRDADGRQSVSDGSASGQTVHLRTALGALVATETTGPDGSFLFKPKVGLQGVADEFYVEFDVDLGEFEFTTANVGTDDTVDSDADSLGQTPSVTFTAPGQSVLDLDAGLLEVLGLPVIGDRVWLDSNMNGVQDLDEYSRGGSDILLLNELGVEIAGAFAGKDGLYFLPGPPSGTYQLEIVPSEGAALVPKGAGDNTLLDSDFDPFTRRTDFFTYTGGETRRDFDAGIVIPSAAQIPTVPADDSSVLVNTYTTGDQKESEVAVDGNGNFVIVWESADADGDSDNGSIHGRRFASDGSALGDQFQVNTYTTGDQFGAALAMQPNGDFVVAWASYGYENGDTWYLGVQAQRFASDGSLLGPQFLVNTYTTYIQTNPSVGMDAAGNFVIVWQSEGGLGDDTDGYSVQGQRFASSGELIGDQFQINTYTPDGQRSPDVAVGPEGDFIVVWQNGSSPQQSTEGRRFASDGTAIGGQFQVNTFTGANQGSEPAVALGPTGQFAVVWEGDGSPQGDTSYSSVHGRVFASDGNPLGDQFQINAYTTNRQTEPDVAMDGDGDVVVVWDSFGSDNGDDDRHSVQALRYSSSGDPIGERFIVNAYTTDSQRQARVAVDEHGDFVVAWLGYRLDNGDSSSRSIQARRFRATADVGDRVFFDTGSDGRQIMSSGPGVEGVTVNLRNMEGDLRDSTVSDADGKFNLKAKVAARGIVDQFYLEFEAPPSFVFSPQDVGSDDSLDSDVDPSTGATDPFIILSAGESRLDLDAGLFVLPFFADGFESGDTTAWSRTDN